MALLRKEIKRFSVRSYDPTWILIGLNQNFFGSQTLLFILDYKAPQMETLAITGGIQGFRTFHGSKKCLYNTSHFYKEPSKNRYILSSITYHYILTAFPLNKLLKNQY